MTTSGVLVIPTYAGEKKLLILIGWYAQWHSTTHVKNDQETLVGYSERELKEHQGAP